MILVTAGIKSKSGERNKIISKSKDLIESTRLESDCISYNLYESVEDVDLLLMFEQWKTTEALESHMQTEHFKAFGAAIEDFLAEELDITIYSAEKV
ncbi:MAG: Antibiotic biosynthesis monooxygenase [Methanobacterium sp. PtaU1.Bin242]|nr:MAG: Antibiotic biosynthesis monooxygenase [Methanobacterium sp. PtaU1.Bin242]